MTGHAGGVEFLQLMKPPSGEGCIDPGLAADAARQLRAFVAALPPASPRDLSAAERIETTTAALEATDGRI